MSVQPSEAGDFPEISAEGAGSTGNISAVVVILDSISDIVNNRPYFNVNE